MLCIHLSITALTNHLLLLSIVYTDDTHFCEEQHYVSEIVYICACIYAIATYSCLYKYYYTYIENLKSNSIFVFSPFNIPSNSSYAKVFEMFNLTIHNYINVAIL